MISIPALTCAEAWQIRPQISLEERYEDNVKLKRIPEDPVAETLLRGVLSFRRETEVSDMALRLHSNLSTYSKSGHYLTMSADKKTELSRWGIKGLYRRDTTTRTIEPGDGVAELDDQVGENVVSDVSDIDEGLIQVDVTRNTLRLKPFTQYQINERSTVGFQYYLLNVFYDNNRVGTGVYDYNQHGLNGSYFRRMSERDTLVLFSGISRFSSDNVGTVILNQELSAGYRRSLSEISSFGINTGVRRTFFKSDMEESNSSGFVLRFKANRKTELSRFGVTVEHDLKPSGTGDLSESNLIRLEYNRKLKERLIGSLRIRASETKGVGRSTSNEIYFLQLEPQVKWSITQWWSLRGGYKYRRREQIDSLNDADSHMVYIAISYSKQIDIE